MYLVRVQWLPKPTIRHTWGSCYKYRFVGLMLELVKQKSLGVGLRNLHFHRSGVFKSSFRFIATKFSGNCRGPVYPSPQLNAQPNISDQSGAFVTISELVFGT